MAFVYLDKRKNAQGGAMKSIDISKIKENFSRKDGDTGSPEVQIALLTHRIAHLTQHFNFHKKDHNSRRGLFLLVGRRRRLLEHLKKIDNNKYLDVIGKLGIRR